MHVREGSMGNLLQRASTLCQSAILGMGRAITSSHSMRTLHPAFTPWAQRQPSPIGRSAIISQDVEQLQGWCPGTVQHTWL